MRPGQFDNQGLHLGASQPCQSLRASFSPCCVRSVPDMAALDVMELLLRYPYREVQRFEGRKGGVDCAERSGRGR